MHLGLTNIMCKSVIYDSETDTYLSYKHDDASPKCIWNNSMDGAITVDINTDIVTLYDICTSLRNVVVESVIQDIIKFITQHGDTDRIWVVMYDMKVTTVDDTQLGSLQWHLRECDFTNAFRLVDYDFTNTSDYEKLL